MLAIKAPINNLSFGNVSYNIVKRIFSEREVNFFPIGNGLDFSSFVPEQEVANKINSSAIQARRRCNKNDTTLHLWHISGILETSSNKRVGLTFHETDQLTPTEVNLLNQLDLVLVTSSYTKAVFESQTSTKVVNVGLGFDSKHFFKTGKKYFNEDVTVFSLNGKMEARKSTLRVLKLWAAKYGNDKRYLLNASITNPFIKEQQPALIKEALGGKTYFNINFLPFVRTNLEYNEVLNSAHIDLTGMAVCEGFNLPAFQSLCLGKQSVILNAHAHKDYVNENNSILVQPTGMQDAVDGVFFRKGEEFNQGRWFDFNNEEFVGATELAVSKARMPNSEGEKLKDIFTYEKTVKTILQEVDSL